jgi:hypothetical protein
VAGVEPRLRLLLARFSNPPLAALVSTLLLLPLLLLLLLPLLRSACGR